ncbi:phosphoribosylformimino-5-aminoimidazole carboxamide ribotide isomerase [Verrucomicrobiaceae bacterium N1E253]|uniref:Phosphoribosylformimino-5-aminoimidazole carboxamide ribotide isomerase n=1 Tax=Oceaniferula marina TaxID=2748318 RepID=A0A851GSZ5_9BACT|nr:phosphoribosylformimino-5-aminoimidazole carboxamide ribotide isomerase [Oceaniferula marina]NWK57374.1 phosphoribosylformimino-5-aminoimidazole carboxamide ribotide isomerase [Oceaniferula marina]
MTKFRPCIDLHDGKVKQIVGGTLRDEGAGPKENFVSDRDPAWFSDLYRQSDLRGGHIIQLGAGNQEAARDALGAWPGGMQLGGGVNLRNAVEWIESGASQVIVTSWLFDQDGRFREDRLKELAREIGRERLVVDLSCRKTKSGWTVAMNRWQTLTSIDVTHATLDALAEWCAEYLIHAADVEGLCGGVDAELIDLLGAWGGVPMTYAGGVAHMDDLNVVAERSGGNIDVTVGSALDLFGGSGVRYEELLAWNERSKV